MSAGPFKRGKVGAYRPISEINVTPMVDVMLVLLVIFMVTAPLLTVGVPVDLPKTQAQALNENVEPLVISIDAQGRVFIQETETEIDSLTRRLSAVTKNKTDTRIYVRGDRAINYGHVMRVMGLVTAAGYNRVALVAQQPSSANSPRK